MKKQYIIIALGAMLMASCADQFDRHFETVRPDKAEKYAYLTEYKALKEYVTDPNFHLGVGTDAAEYASQGVAYVVTNVNFNETVAGNAMKMGSVVDADGNMNFGPVEEYVKTANAAGMNVYGHTLAWHSQQPVKWLASLIADKVDPNYKPGEKQIVETEEEATCIKVVSDDMADAAWDTQFWLLFDQKFAEGDSWEVSMKVRADKAATAGTQTHNAPGEYIHWAAIGTVPFTTEWAEYKASGNITAEQNGGYSIAFNLNDFAEANTYYFDDLSFKLNGVELIANGNCDDPTGTANYRTKEARGAVVDSRIVDKIIVKKEVDAGGSGGDIEQRVERNCIQVCSADMAENPWDTQFWLVIDENTPMHQGDSWEVSMNVRADLECDAGTQTHKEPSGYIHWAAIGTVHFTPEWQNYKASGTVTAEQEGGWSIAFNLNDFASANNYYFDDISFKLNGVEMIQNGDCEGSNTASFVSKEDRGDLVPSRIVDHYIEVIHQESNNGMIALTPQEKKDTLTWAMEKWISGMMEACSDEESGQVLVKAWDAVNEALSGGDKDGDGLYDLQHSEGYKPGGTWDVGGDAFYWQDYLTDDDYVPIVIALARKYGGSDLKLFINDYNLESDWDQNGKLKSLIKWIEKWESDGVTKIDGIGTQMHISYYENAQTQESKKKAIENHFKLLAESGKLVRISELDMGLVDADGNDVKTADVTEEQHHAMAEYYTWIIKKYKELIPAAQQWGICQWCATDSPAGNAWRANQPVGLWDKDYYRKHTYAGFADGLSGE